jgi:hypothetical protein
VVAGLLRDWSCSIVLGGANCNGRHAELVNKIKGPRFNTPTTNQEVGSSSLSGRANYVSVYFDEIGDGLFRLLNPELVHCGKRIRIVCLKARPVAQVGTGRVVGKACTILMKHTGIQLEAEEVQPDLA